MENGIKQFNIGREDFMRILFVDDESSKIKALHGALRGVSGLNEEDLEHVLDLRNARKKLKEQFYDLVIMDLRISEDIADSPNEVSETAGLSFIDEIISIDSLHTPQNIIILTEFEELKERCLNLGRYNQFQILKYDLQSLEWADIIKGKTEYLIKVEESKKRFSEQMDTEVAFICAVDDEMKALKNVFKSYKSEEINFKYDDNVYYKTEYNENGKQIRIVIAQQREMGMTAASCLSQDIIRHFSPKYIIMIGIAAGVGNDKNFGDILVATEVWNYSSGKYSKGEDNKAEFLPDPKYISIDQSILNVLKKDYTSILAEIKRDWQSDNNLDPKLVYGSLACGTAVVGNENIVEDRIKNHARKTIGLDMESYGLYFAANYGLDKRTVPICLKAISDFADENKGDSYHAFAAYVSASFAKYLAIHELQY